MGSESGTCWGAQGVWPTGGGGGGGGEGLKEEEEEEQKGRGWGRGERKKGGSCLGIWGGVEELGPNSTGIRRGREGRTSGRFFSLCDGSVLWEDAKDKRVRLVPPGRQGGRPPVTRHWEGQGQGAMG